MMDLKGRHIMRVGTWNDVKITEKDLDDIVSNFATMQSEHHVPLKFGHNDEQPLTDGQPAIGWIKRVYRKGKDLLADFSDVPKVVMDAINAKRYRTVSVELLKNAEFNGKTIKSWLLDAVALLGADQPAVSGLKDLADLSLARTVFDGGHRAVFSKAGNFQSFSKEDPVMDKDDVQDLIDAAVDPLKKELSRKDEEIKELKASKKEADTKVSTLEAEKAEREKAEKEESIKASRKAANDVLDAAVKQKAITPAQREVYEKTFGIKDDEKVVSLELSDLKTAIGFEEDKNGEKSAMFSRDEDDDMSNEPLDVQVVQATRKVMANKPDLDYTTAQEIALGANPVLARKYLDSNGVFNADGGVDR